MPILHINDEPIHYKLSGNPEGPVLVFSNSLGTTLSLWDEQAAYLGRDFHILQYDTRGHGESVKSPGPYSIEQLGRDVLALTSTLGIDKFHFCGISMGGAIGQWLGVNAADRVLSLVLCNTGAKIGTAEAWAERAGTVTSNGMGPIADATPPRWFTPDFVNQHPERVNPWVDALRQTDPAGYAACCMALSNSDLREDIRKITVPTLVLTGTHDPVTTPADSDFIASRIPGAQRVDLPASHLSNLEAPEEFNKAVGDFLRG